MSVTQGKELVGVVGAGTMGAGIAQVAAAADHEVLLYDELPEAVDSAIQRVHAGLEKRVARGKLAPAQMERIRTLIRPARALEELASVDLAIEAIVEELDAKRTVFEALESICAEQAVLATNTSSLSVTEIAATLELPSRFIGLHFFNPAPAMKLVEVVSGRMTSPGVANRMSELLKTWGKHCVQARSTPGFIVNRVARPYYGEAFRLLQEQAAVPAEIDVIMRECGGFRMGPCELMDLIGHDVNYAVTRSVFEAFYGDPRYAPSLIQKDMIDAGLLGRKSGRGFFEYATDEPEPAPPDHPPKSAPDKIAARGDLGVASSLPTLMKNAGIEVERTSGPGWLEFDGGILAMTDGRTATFRSAAENADVVLFDLVHDYVTSTRVVLSKADQTTAEVLAKAIGIFQALGKTVSVIDDCPGMVVMRTVCMLANEGADAVHQGVCDARAVDTAMRYGTGYPLGPLAWADRIGVGQVVAVLSNLQQSYGEDRYRVSPLLRRRALAGAGLYEG